MSHRLKMVALMLVGLATLATASACDENDAGAKAGSDQSSTSVPHESDPVTAGIDACPRSGQPVESDTGLPNLELPCLGPGRPVRMSGLSGRPLIVNVWASWCAPCRTEMPWLQRLVRTGAVDVLGVDAEDQSAAASGLLQELGVRYPSVFDPENQFAHEVGIVTKPMSLLVSPTGDVEHVVPGPFESYEQIVQLIDEHLGVQVK